MEFLLAAFTLALAANLVLTLRSRHYRRLRDAARKPPADRLPEIGDEYLILDHVWRVRSREALSYGSRNDGIRYTIYIEFVESGMYAFPFDGVKHKMISPKWLTEFAQFIGNPEKDQAKLEQDLTEMSMKHGISSEEVRVALDSDTGDVDMSKLPDHHPVKRGIAPESLITLTGHKETDENTRDE